MTKVIVIVVAIILGVSGLIYMNYKGESARDTGNAAINNSNTTRNQVYTDTKYRFSMEYPGEYIFSEDQSTSSYYLSLQNKYDYTVAYSLQVNIGDTNFDTLEAYAKHYTGTEMMALRINGIDVFQTTSFGEEGAYATTIFQDSSKNYYVFQVDLAQPQVGYVFSRDETDYIGATYQSIIGSFRFN